MTHEEPRPFIGREHNSAIILASRNFQTGIRAGYPYAQRLSPMSNHPGGPDKDHSNALAPPTPMVNSNTTTTTSTTDQSRGSVESPGPARKGGRQSTKFEPLTPTITMTSTENSKPTPPPIGLRLAGAVGTSPYTSLVGELVVDDDDIVDRVERQVLRRLANDGTTTITSRPVTVTAVAVKPMSQSEDNEKAPNTMVVVSNRTFRVMALALLALLVLIATGSGIGAAVMLRGSNDSSAATPIVVPASESPTISPQTANPTRSPTTNNPTNAPISPPSATISPTNKPFSTANPTSAPSPKPVFNYTISGVAPRTEINFDDMQTFGTLSSGESNIRKISQIQVFLSRGCLNDCSSTSFDIIGLVTMYLLHDCTMTSVSHGSFMDDGGDTPVAVIDLPNDVYVTRIEVYTEDYITHIKICTSSDICYGPFGTSLDTAPTTVFGQSNSVIKAFYGFSGTWFDSMGVYYEDAGVATNPCS